MTILSAAALILGLTGPSSHADEIRPAPPFPPAGVYPVKDPALCVPGAGNQSSFAWFTGPRTEAPTTIDTLNADGSVTESGRRRVVGVADIRVFTPLCFASAPSADVYLEVKQCNFLHLCDWKTLDHVSYSDLPKNGSRVSRVLAASAYRGTHDYRIQVIVSGLKSPDAEQGQGRAPGVFGFSERGEQWFSAKDVKLDG